MNPALTARPAHPSEAEWRMLRALLLDLIAHAGQQAAERGHEVLCFHDFALVVRRSGSGCRLCLDVALFGSGALIDRVRTAFASDCRQVAPFMHDSMGGHFQWLPEQEFVVG